MAEQALQGVKVVGFTWLAVGPQTTRELAVHGATVVQVESHRRPDIARSYPPFKGKPHLDSSAFYAAFNPNKYGISLDLDKPRGREVARRLVRWADVLVESMTPGVMGRWELDYESCRRINPTIIYVSTTQHGQHGPYSRMPGFGAFAAAWAGYCELTGYPDRDPGLLHNNYTDFVAPWFLVTLVLAALAYRRRTGRSIYIDQSQTEAGLQLLGPALLDYSVNRRAATRRGNRDPYMAPHGVYPCRGDDRWVAIAVSNDAEWQALCRAMGEPAWTRDPRFSSPLSRKKHEDELDRLIAEWTAERDAEEVMLKLQEAGVPAGVVQTGEDLFRDPQLAHREHFRFLEHKYIGRQAYNSPAYRLSRTPCSLSKPAPCLGEDNLYVYTEILGYSEEEVSDLIAEGVITTEADIPER